MTLYNKLICGARGKVLLRSEGNVAYGPVDNRV